MAYSLIDIVADAYGMEGTTPEDAGHVVTYGDDTVTIAAGAAWLTIVITVDGEGDAVLVVGDHVTYSATVARDAIRALVESN